MHNLRKGKIKIDFDRCKGCLLCIEECRFKELKAGTKANKYGYLVPEFVCGGNCNACMLCAIVCPEAAIEVFEIIEAKK